MTPQDLIRAAAKIIETQGWCSGTDNKGKIVHVRDQSGIPLPLYKGDNTGQDKAKVNPGARSFSIYGALAKALHDAKGAVADPGSMWLVLDRMAASEPGARQRGGTNWVHPVIDFNEREDMTKDGVLAFLERCAVEFEPSAGIVEPKIDLGPEIMAAITAEDAQRATEQAPIDIPNHSHPVTPEPKYILNPGLMTDPRPNTYPVDQFTILDKDVAPINPAPVKAPVPSTKAEPAVDAAKAGLPPINWGE
jgi:hypothetical protein